MKVTIQGPDDTHQEHEARLLTSWPRNGTGNTCFGIEFGEEMRGLRVVLELTEQEVQRIRFGQAIGMETRFKQRKGTDQ